MRSTHVACSGGEYVIRARRDRSAFGARRCGRRATIVEWLRRTVSLQHRVICICSGALLAGRAGLLDGKNCTTHHGCTDELQRVAPRARVLDNRLYVEDGDLLTSAGITAGIDLMLYVVLGMLGPAVALSVARYLVVYVRRAGGDAQISPWLEARNHFPSDDPSRARCRACGSLLRLVAREFGGARAYQPADALSFVQRADRDERDRLREYRAGGVGA